MGRGRRPGGLARGCLHRTPVARSSSSTHERKPFTTMLPARFPRIQRTQLGSSAHVWETNARYSARPRRRRCAASRHEAGARREAAAKCLPGMSPKRLMQDSLDRL